jgi:hypothetical protein
LPEVLCRAQAVGGQNPDPDKVVEVGERIELLQLLDGIRGQGLVVAARDL